jgi:thiol-disulfide isomerase/thioredoxin
MFLVGKGIPDHITSLPQTVLNTPFGQMLKPQLDEAMRGITQAPVPAISIPQPNRESQSTSNGLSSQSQMNGFISKEHIPGVVYKPTRVSQLDELLASAKETCAVIFFTSATCPPCKIVYPAYDELAADAGNKAVLVKVDLSKAYEIGAKYQVRATPTFITFLRGEKENEWSGANESQLRGNVELLLHMAHPAHPHTLLSLPTLRRPHKTPVTYTKIPPIDKLINKMGPMGEDPAVSALKEFVTSRQQSGAVDAPLPALPDLSAFILNSMEISPPENLFPIVDLFRVSLVDPRLSGYFAEDSAHTVLAILLKVTELDARCPYQLRIVTLHMACNLFTSSLFSPKLLSEQSLSTALLQLVTSSLLDPEHPAVRVAAASLAFNIATTNHQRRLAKQEDLLPEDSQVELLASLLEAMGRERESKDGLRGLLLAVGLLKYMSSKGGEVDDLCKAVGAKDVVTEAKEAFGDLKELVKEVELVMK